MLTALDQIEFLLLPVRRFVELDQSKSPDEYLDYPRVYIRRLNTLLERLYSQKDEIKLQESILSTNVDYFQSPRFRFGVFFTRADAADIFDVINAREEEKLEGYWKQLDKIRFSFRTKFKEINELRKEADANIQLFYTSLDKVMGLINTQRQRFFDDITDIDDLGGEKKEWIFEKIREHMKTVIDRRERVIETTNQITFILKEVIDFKEPVGQLLKEAEPEVQLILISNRQFGKERDIDAETYFDKKEQEGREKAMRDKVVQNIRKGGVKIEDIQDPEIGEAVLTPNATDPVKEGDPFFHLKDQKEVDKELEERAKNEKDKQDNMRGDTRQEDDQV